MNKSFFILMALVLGLLSGGLASGDVPEFDHYRVILTRKPFGEPPPIPPPPPPPAIPDAESFARDLRLCAINRVDEDEEGEYRLEVGIFNNRDQSSFYLQVGEIVDGIELLSADYEGEFAVLKKGTDIRKITFQQGEMQSLTQEQAQTQVAQGMVGYAERRRAREEQRRQRKIEMEEQAKKQPQLTGEALEKHLLEYQMEVIRQGLPPLPIPLTEEMDAQLVAEGYLPPMDEDLEETQ